MKKYGVKKLAQKKLIIYSSIQLIITAVSLYFLRDVFNIAFSLFFIFPYILAVYLSTTMRYAILPDRIRFRWGLMGRSK
jgi:hypothetical protein